MAATFEPRKVEPGALSRWARQALALTRRSPLIWLAAGCVFMALATLLRNSWLGLAVLGMWCHVHFQLLANRADRNDLRAGDLLSALAASLLETGLHLRRSTATVLVSASTVAMVPLLTGQNPLYGHLGLAQVAPLVGTPVWAGLGTALALGGLLLSSGMGFMTHGFLLARVSGLPLTQVLSLARNQRQKNGALGVRFDVAHLLLCAGGTAITPLLAPVAGFLGAWAYVSFRDIYLHRGENQPLHATATVPDAARAWGSA